MVLKKKYIQQSTKQYTEGQTIQWPKEKVQTTIYKTIHRRTDNTMADRKSTYNNLPKQYTEGQTIHKTNPDKVQTEITLTQTYETIQTTTYI